MTCCGHVGHCGQDSDDDCHNNKKDVDYHSRTCDKLLEEQYLFALVKPCFLRKNSSRFYDQYFHIFIGPESNHCPLPCH